MREAVFGEFMDTTEAVGHGHLSRRARRNGRGVLPPTAIVLLVGIGANTALVLTAWQLAYPGHPRQIAAPPAASAGPAATVTRAPQEFERTSPANDASPIVARKPTATLPLVATRAESPPQLVLKAARGDCWLEVRIGSAKGRLLFFGTLEQGQSLPFRESRLWLAFGAGSNLDVTLNNQRVESFPSGTATVTVTAEGVRRPAGLGL